MAQKLGNGYDKCTYHKITDCKRCDYKIYRKCPKFIKAHLCYLIRGLLPCQLTDQVRIKKDMRGVVAHSGSEIAIKSAAAKTALLWNCEVRHLTLSQALDSILGKTEYTERIYFLSLNESKAGSNQEYLQKIRLALTGFIEGHQIEGHAVFIWTTPNPTPDGKTPFGSAIITSPEWMYYPTMDFPQISSVHSKAKPVPLKTKPKKEEPQKEIKVKTEPVDKKPTKPKGKELDVTDLADEAVKKTASNIYNTVSQDDDWLC